MMFRLAAVGVVALLTVGCDLSSSGGGAPTIVGVWEAHKPYITFHRLYLGYSCFEADGDYNFFETSRPDTATSEMITGIQWNTGVWESFGADSLRIEQTLWGFLTDDNGIGKDWQQRTVLEAHYDLIEAKVRVTQDSLYAVKVDSTVAVGRVKLPEELKGSCH